MPYLNRPIKQSSWKRYVPWWADHYHGHSKVDKSIQSFPAPRSVDGNTVTFVDGSTYECDTIVFATGYRQTFPFLHDPQVVETAAGEGLAAKGRSPRRSRSPSRHSRSPSRRGGTTSSTAKRVVGPDSTGAHMQPGRSAGSGWVAGTGARGSEDPLPSEHFIVSPDAPRLAFIGFVRPNVGAIPPMAEMQVLWWIQRLRGQVHRGALPPSYGLLGKKLNYGVDYGNYMHQLAAEIGAAPSVSDLVHRPRVLIAYALGQAYVSFFRLVGPFASKRAWETAENELYELVPSRGTWTNVIFVATMVAFALMNLWAYALEAVVQMVAPAWLARYKASERECAH
jgi:hypothetical protein